VVGGATSLVTALHDRWDELRHRWRMTSTVKARARDRCEFRLLGVCNYWGKVFHELVSAPCSADDIVYACRECSEFVRDNPEWAKAKGLLNRPL
jgi:hypothetical protein